MSATDEAVFTHGSLMRHVSVMSFTASIGLMAIFAVDFIDMIFIATLGNPSLAAAIGYAGTVLFFTSSISIGLSIAAGVLVARSIGAGKSEQAADFASSVLLLGLAVSAICVVAIYINADSLLSLLGANGETLMLAGQYLSIILPTMPVLMAAMVAGAVLRAHGDARRATVATLAGGVVNAALDPVLIFGLDMELAGAAWASVAARCTIFVASVWPVLRIYKGFAPLRARRFTNSVGSIAGIAVPAVLANVATPIGSGVVTREMARFGSDAVAGMAIIGRLTPVAFALVFALSGAIGAIIGQNYGAGLHQRVRGAFYAALQFATGYVLVVALLLFLVRDLITQAFTASGDTAVLLLLFCGPLALAHIFTGWIFVGNAAFNNLGHPSYATWINWGRNTLGTWPLAVLGAMIWGAGGVLIGQALGSVLFALISVWLARHLMRENEKPHSPGQFDSQLRLHVLECRRH